MTLQAERDMFVGYVDVLQFGSVAPSSLISSTVLYHLPSLCNCANWRLPANQRVRRCYGRHGAQPPVSVDNPHTSAILLLLSRKWSASFATVYSKKSIFVISMIRHPRKNFQKKLTPMSESDGYPYTA